MFNVFKSSLSKDEQYTRICNGSECCASHLLVSFALVAGRLQPIQPARQLKIKEKRVRWSSEKGKKRKKKFNVAFRFDFVFINSSVIPCHDKTTNNEGEKERRVWKVDGKLPEGREKKTQLINR